MSAEAKTANALGVDWWLLAAGLLLAAFGLIMVLSASGIMAERFFGAKYHFFHRQALFCAVGAVCMAACAVIPRRVVHGGVYIWLALVIALFLATAFSPLGVEVNGAKRWLRLGPLSVQPLEMAKVALVLYLAYFFAGKQDKVQSFAIGFIPPFAVTGLLAMLLLAQPDFGGAAMLCALLFLMCLAGGTRFVYLFMTFALACGAAVMLILHSPYRLKRMLAFLDPFQDAGNTGYQLVQSLYAFGAGRITGVGLGAGRQKLFFLPEAHNDFLMAVVGEETGFLGVSVVFVLIGIILWRSFLTALRQDDLRDRFTAYGLTLVLGLGFLMNLAVVLGTVPPKGVPMPFLSYGGSQVVMSFVCLGLLLNLSRTARPGRQGERTVQALGPAAMGGAA
ncbi:cell division protein FtsW [Alkalidesulfovibrio alkalitolerans DSM 16529]|uniref:Probable peptidoglycan glycosyltransferase FtsW n=1 Tax=Alkalidesulfovibrio alkalitolerans DSM 16529 TaxID=1121439 RepID=S7TEL6_9BACT|nr:putative lipid II flippase FtsW [Alkalidesulfovibrio alkalitolerans]EPR35131.1 cell division protein FtsW [Alkalidesulfovibrio alkalitolerans DSM 16529]